MYSSLIRKSLALTVVLSATAASAFATNARTEALSGSLGIEDDTDFATFASETGEAGDNVWLNSGETGAVSWDGKVLLCTTDVQQTMKVGEATLDSLSESWWNGQRLHQIRKQAVREDFSGLNLCRGCNQPYSPNAAVIDKDEIARYMAAVT